MGVVVAESNAENMQPQSDTETSSVGAELVVQKEPEIPNAGPRLTEATLNKLLRSDTRNYYLTKELNDKLFIHYGGYRKLENLEPFTGLRVLYAECNSFARLEGLSYCSNLRSLFLNQNCIRKIENLDNNTELWSVNLSDNFIEKIENIEHLSKLNTLIISNNNLGTNGISDLLGLRDSPLSVLDLQNNKIDDESVVDEIFVHMPNLTVLYLKNNPVIKKVQNYRKSLIIKLPKLRFLDDRPIFEDERRLAEAFGRGGLDAERAERRLIQQEKENEYRRNAEAFDAMIDAAKVAHRETVAMRAQDRYTSADSDPVDSLEKKQRKWYEANLDISDPPPTIDSTAETPTLSSKPAVQEQPLSVEVKSERRVAWDEPIFETSDANPQHQYEFQPPARAEAGGRRMEIVEADELPPLEPVPVNLDEMD